MQGQEWTVTKWTQVYFSDYLSQIGGLFTAIMAFANFLFAGYQKFVAQKSMLKRLYGEEDFDAPSGASDFVSSSSPKETLQAKIEKKKDFDASFCRFVMVSCFRSFCCCLASCCKTQCRRSLDSHKKF